MCLSVAIVAELSPVEREERQAKELFNAAQEAGVKHFVYSGVDRNGFKPTPCGLFAVKHRVEDYIIKNANGKIGWTFLQPVTFMDNFVNKDFRVRMFFTGVEVYTGAEKELDLIATEDIGKAAAKVFLVSAVHLRLISIDHLADWTSFIEP